jgi:sarcosine oxidase
VADAVVVGAGAVGTSTALALAERGAETVLLERFEVGHELGSSHGATRIFRFAYPEPLYVRLAQRSLGAWRRLEELAGEELLLSGGGLYTGSWAEDCATGLAEAGAPHEWLGAEAAAERFPAIHFEPGERILWQQDGGTCLAARTVAAQLRLARERGVEVRERSPAVRIAARDGGVEVETEAGAIAARAAVVVAGAWAAELLDPLGIRLALTPSLAQVGYYPPLDHTPVPSSLPHFVESGDGAGMLGPGGYWVPPAPGQDAVKVGLGAPGHAVDPRDGPFPVDPGWAARDAGFVARRRDGLAAGPAGGQTRL